MRIAKSPSELGFNRYDAPRLAKALERATNKRIFQRLQAVLLVAQGLTADEVAVIENVSAQAVYNWIYRYLDQHQVASLRDLPRSGRPPTAKQITDARILQEMRRNPLQLGYRTTTWTVELLADHLSRRYGCAINPHTLRRRMKAIGLKFKRPRYFYEEKDPHRIQKKGRSYAD
jgi:transposase